MDENRSRRSNDPLEATQLQLQQILKDFGVENCALVSADGVLVSAQTLSAKLSSLLKNLPVAFENGQKLKQTQLSACEFRVRGEQMYVAVVGHPGTMRDLALYRAILGVRRILQ